MFICFRVLGSRSEHMGTNHSLLITNLKIIYAHAKQGLVKSKRLILCNGGK
jgi:hypothetical protein